jgi:hypothetical protein
MIQLLFDPRSFGYCLFIEFAQPDIVARSVVGENNRT